MNTSSKLGIFSVNIIIRSSATDFRKAKFENQDYEHKLSFTPKNE